MMLTIDFWQLVGMAGTLCGALWGLFKLALNQWQRRQDERLLRIERAALDEAQERKRLEREMKHLQVELPRDYVRREDYIRGQAVIEAKQDALAGLVSAVQQQLAALIEAVKGSRI